MPISGSEARSGTVLEFRFGFPRENTLKNDQLKSLKHYYRTNNTLCTTYREKLADVAFYFRAENSKRHLAVKTVKVALNN